MKNIFLKSRPLKREAFWLLFMCMFVLFATTLVIGLRFYIFSTVRNYKHSLENLASFSLSQLDIDYVEELFAETKRTYESMPEDIQLQPLTDDFRAYFWPLMKDQYYESREILRQCRESTDISNIYLGFYDVEKERLVLVLDGDTPENYYIPGQYIKNEVGNLDSWPEIQKIMASDSKMSVAHTPIVGYAATDYLPLYGKDGSLIGVVAIDTLLNKFSDELRSFLVVFFPAMLAIFIFQSLVITRALDREVISPINSLSSAAGQYTARDKVNDSGSTSYFGNVKISSVKEIRKLKDTMAYMEEDIHESMQEICRVSADKERIAAELSIAATIQMSALPTAFPESDKFDLYATMDPAKQVGGDFYDFFMVDDDHIAMVIADVSGKGVPAALFMMKGKELIKSRTLKGGKPSEILEYANNELMKNNDECMFITIWLGMLEISTGIITAANAGHEYPIVSDAEGNFRLFEEPHGVLCGAVEGVTYEDYTISVPKGGGIFVYTDGVAEAVNADDEAYGLERIEKCLSSNKDVSSRSLIDSVKRDVESFTAGNDQFDDITMLCLLMR